MKKGLFLLVIIGIALGGCSSKQPPTDKISNLKMAIVNAKNSDASIYAPLELKIAQDKYLQIQKAMDNKDYEKAEQLADFALSDARLAEAKARSEKTKEIVNSLIESIDTLKDEITRKQNR